MGVLWAHQGFIGSGERVREGARLAGGAGWRGLTGAARGGGG